MERGSDTHAPRVDDELASETRGMVHGAPLEPRVEEFREQEEPAAGGEPVPDARLDVDEAEARAELARSIGSGGSRSDTVPGLP